MPYKPEMVQILLKIKRYKGHILFLAALLAVTLSVALLVSLIMGRYQQSFAGYGEILAAEYNVVLLDGDYGHASLLSASGGGGYVTGFSPNKIILNPMDPTDEEKRRYFTVANGTTAANHANVKMQYNVRMNTTSNLPLKFSLSYYGTQEGEEDTYDQYPEVYIAYGTPAAEGDRVFDELGAGSISYRFYDEEQFNGDGTLKENAREASFYLSGSSLSIAKHAISAEWPKTVTVEENGGTFVYPQNKEKYRKEIDVFEVLIESSSVNMLLVEGYGDPPPEPDYYGVGRIVIPLEEIEIGDTATYFHNLSWQGFQEQSPGINTYRFAVQNCGKTGLETDPIATHYTVQVILPFDAITGDDPVAHLTAVDYIDDGAGGFPDLTVAGSGAIRYHILETGTLVEDVPVGTEGIHYRKVYVIGFNQEFLLLDGVYLPLQDTTIYLTYRNQHVLRLDTAYEAYMEMRINAVFSAAD